MPATIWQQRRNGIFVKFNGDDHQPDNPLIEVLQSFHTVRLIA